MKYLKKYENASDFNAEAIATEIREKVSKDEFFEMVKEQEKELPGEGQAQTELASEVVIIELIRMYKNGEKPFEGNQKKINPDQQAELEVELTKQYSEVKI